MAFYDDKKKANLRIDELIKDETPIELIYFKIETEFGFGEKFVKNRIERIKSILEIHQKPENGQKKSQKPENGQKKDPGIA